MLQVMFVAQQPPPAGRHGMALAAATDVPGVLPGQVQHTAADRQQGLPLIRLPGDVLRRGGVGAYHQQAMVQLDERLLAVDVQPQLAAQAHVAGGITVQHRQPQHGVPAARLLHPWRGGRSAVQSGTVGQPHLERLRQRATVQRRLPAARRGTPLDPQPGLSPGRAAARFGAGADPAARYRAGIVTDAAAVTCFGAEVGAVSRIGAVAGRRSAGEQSFCAGVDGGPRTGTDAARRASAQRYPELAVAHRYGALLSVADEGTGLGFFCGVARQVQAQVRVVRWLARRAGRRRVDQNPARRTVGPAAVDAGLRAERAPAAAPFAGAGQRDSGTGRRMQGAPRHRHAEPQRQTGECGDRRAGELHLYLHRSVRRRRYRGGAHRCRGRSRGAFPFGRRHVHRINAAWQQIRQRQGVQRGELRLGDPHRRRLRAVCRRFQRGGRVGHAVHRGGSVRAAAGGRSSGHHLQAFDDRRERAGPRALRQQHQTLQAARAAARGGGLHPLHRGVEADRPLQHQQVAPVVVPVRGDYPHRLRTEADLEGQLLAGGVVRQQRQVVGARQRGVLHRHPEAVPHRRPDPRPHHARRAVQARIGVAGQPQVGHEPVQRLAIQRRPSMVARIGQQGPNPRFLGNVDAAG